MSNPKPLNRVNVVDVESTCWDSPNPPKGQNSEIIEIGISVLNLDTMEIESTESILVRPVASTVSPFCTKLTTLTQELIDAEGIGFSEALRKLQDTYKSKQRLWVSFGDYDRKMFEKMCKLKGCEYPFGPRHLNVKTLIALGLGDSTPRELGMDDVLKKLNIPLEGTHHRGGDDSKNIAKILRRTMKALRAGFTPNGGFLCLTE